VTGAKIYDERSECNPFRVFFSGISNGSIRNTYLSETPYVADDTEVCKHTFFMETTIVNN